MLFETEMSFRIVHGRDITAGEDKAEAHVIYIIVK